MNTPQIKQEYAWYKLKIHSSTIHRWGVYAQQNIPRGKYVIEYTGQVLNRRQHKLIENRKMVYTYKLDNYWTLDGAVNGSGAERVNHSCDPNLKCEIRGHRVFFISLRPIKKGEELTIDYCFEWCKKPTICLCGTKKCRGTINYPKVK